MGSLAARFRNRSRVAFFGGGPHSGGNIISFSLWIQTSKASEMILVHHGAIFDGLRTSKDCFLLTLNDGVPNLYTSPKKKLFAVASTAINDGTWHHIAVTMPKKSCFLSEVILYVDGKKVTTNVDADDHVFHVTSGRMSLGGFGYSSSYYEEIFPQTKQYVGLMDDFKLWSRTIQDSDLPTIQSEEKTFTLHNRRTCRKDGTEILLHLSFRKCSTKCMKRQICLGFEWSNIDGEMKCYMFKKTPELGPKVKRTKCGIAKFQ